MRTLEEQGFEIIPEVLNTVVVSSLTAAIESSAVYRSRAGMRHALEIEAVRLLATDSRLISLAQQALGDGATPFRATLFENSSKSNWLVVWHQDTALPLRDRHDVNGWGPWSVKEGAVCAHAPAWALEQALAIRVHLDDSTADNGPLRVLPATHKLGILSDDAICELAKRTQAVACRIGSGGLLLMKPLLVHASSKITNGTPRRVLHIEYSARKSFDGGIELPV
jgi:ectoine hydroxylase-related dioxygenase (phytanoyl-CoA dioxygenase family)